MSEATLPRAVPAYALAAADGLVPRVPPEPPRALPGATAWQVFRGWLVRVLLSGLALVVLGRLADGLAAPGWLTSLLLLAVGCGWVVWALQARTAVGEANVREFEQGYTTLVISLGGFWWRLGLRGRNRGRVPWDYRGCWVLDGEGRTVVSAPDPGFDPPGFYPSPHRSGAWELWTGAAWTGHYRAGT